MKKQIISTPIIAADLTKLTKEINELEKKSACDWLHIDIMDGHFSPTISIGPMIVEAINKVSDLFIDVHLLVDNPEQHIDALAMAGADLISVHIEACPHLHRTIQHIHDKQCLADIALNPAPPLYDLEWVLADSDLVLLMTTNPGYVGRPFISASIRKIEQLKRMLIRTHTTPHIAIEGDLNNSIIEMAAKAGANVFVTNTII